MQFNICIYELKGKDTNEFTFLLMNMIHICIEKRNKMFKRYCELNNVKLCAFQLSSYSETQFVTILISLCHFNIK